MKNSFKYMILLFLISFVIATLCCSGHQIYENYTSYPFQRDKDMDDTIDLNNFENLQGALFKYNEVVVSSSKAGAIDYDIDQVVNDIEEKRVKRIIYSPLLDSNVNQGSMYRPFHKNTTSENINLEQKIEKPKKIKGKKVIVEADKKPDTVLAQAIDPQLRGGLGSTEDVKERTKRNEIYYEPNKCIGEWSEWSTENCNDNQGCGIIYKRYQILSPERVTEDGVGKPCDYKDGLIKYKYCKGDGIDDYESNMERCNLPTNQCFCKLNKETVSVIEGENMYDLLDDDCKHEINRDCICPNSYTMRSVSNICNLEPGIDCSIKEPGCIYTVGSDTTTEMCEKPEFMNEQAETEFLSQYGTFGKCIEKQCVCPNGKPVDSEKCFSDGFEMCDPTVPCDEGYYMAGLPPTCKKRTENNECNCLNGSPKIEAGGSRCSSDSPTYTTYLEEGRILQFCDNECPDGYEYQGGSNAETICNEYYDPMKYVNIRCCIPKYETCKLEESELVERNIIRKDLSDSFSNYQDSTLNELLEVYNNLENIETLLAEDLLSKEDPRDFLLTRIYSVQSSNNNDEENTEEACYDNILLENCNSNFKCAPGYAFLPNEEYSNENEIRMIGCDIKANDEVQNICFPNKNCLRSTEDLIIDTEVPTSETGGTEDEILKRVNTENDRERCLFASNIDEDIFNSKMPGDSDLKYDKYNPDTVKRNKLICQDPKLEGTSQVETCGTDGNCFLKQIQNYYPTWNGSCVPVTCSVSDNIKSVYKFNTSIEECSSTDENCGIGNLVCQGDDNIVPNSNKILYCPAPYKVNSEYNETDYELINFGCSSNPPEPTDAEALRRELMRSQGDIINEDAERLASERQGSINVDNIGERQDLTGSTSEQQLDLELGLEVSSQRREEMAEEVGGQSGDATESGLESASSTRLASFGR
jgi:hypothetical protein